MKTRFPAFRDRAVAMVERLRAAGITIHPACRFGRYLEELQAAASSEFDMPPDHVLRVWHRLGIEVDDLDEISVTLASEPETTGWRQRLSDTLSGGILRTQDQNDCRARSIQFELLVAAVLRKAGYEVMLAEPPDVIARLGALSLGVAVKRPRSAKKVRPHINKGQKQVFRSASMGIVAVDLTVIENPQDKHFTTADFAQTESAIAARAAETTSYVRWREARDVDTTVVYGLLTHLVVPVWEPNERTLSFVQRWSVAPLIEKNDPRAHILADLHERLGYMLAG